MEKNLIINIKELIDSKKRIFCIIICVILGISCKQKPKEIEIPQQNMVLIPSGVFLMGGKSNQASPDELPRHKVSISAFYMDVHEVTNQQFKAFVDATGYKTVAERPLDWDEIKKQVPPGTPKPDESIFKPGSMVFKSSDKPINLRDYNQWWAWKIGANWKHPEGIGSNIDKRMDHPAVHIAYEDAETFAKWAKKRLPTEAEWEWAGMGGHENAVYPWGNEPTEKAYDKANFWQGLFPYKNEEKDGFYGTAPVKSYPANGYGLYEMAGNVWEWCQDKYHFQAYQMTNTPKTLKNPKGPSKSFDPREPYSEKYVTRGGSFLCNDSYCTGYRVARRMGTEKNSSFNHTGFRCAKDIH